MRENIEAIDRVINTRLVHQLESTPLHTAIHDWELDAYQVYGLEEQSVTLSNPDWTEYSALTHEVSMDDGYEIIRLDKNFGLSTEHTMETIIYAHEVGIHPLSLQYFLELPPLEKAGSKHFAINQNFTFRIYGKHVDSECNLDKYCTVAFVVNARSSTIRYEQLSGVNGVPILGWEIGLWKNQRDSVLFTSLEGNRKTTTEGFPHEMHNVALGYLSLIEKAFAVSAS